MKKLNCESRLLAAFLFVLIVATVVFFFSSCEKEQHANRYLLNDTVSVFILTDDTLSNYIYIQIDTVTGELISRTNDYDSRYTRPNGFTYSEQIRYGNGYFTTVSMKAAFDYRRIYGCNISNDSLIKCRIGKDCFVSFYQLTGYTERYYVELLDDWISKGYLVVYSEKKK